MVITLGEGAQDVAVLLEEKMNNSRFSLAISDRHGILGSDNYVFARGKCTQMQLPSRNSDLEEER